MVGYRQAVFAPERSYCRQGRRLAAFHIACCRVRVQGLVPWNRRNWRTATQESAPIIPDSSGMPNTVWKGFAPNPTDPMFATVVFCLKWYKWKVHRDWKKSVDSI